MTGIDTGDPVTDIELSWNADQRLYRFEQFSTMVTYAYDGDGVLIQRAERVGSRSTWVNPLYDRTGLPKIIATKDGDWWAWNGAQPLATSTGGVVTYVVADIKHDVRLGTDTTGSVSGQWAFDVDGNPTATTPEGLWIGWNSELTDTTTGNVWLRARWYDPATARFLTADPWMGNPAEPISLNRYVFANADPVNLSDPSGLYVDFNSSSLATSQSIWGNLRGVQVGLTVERGRQAIAFAESMRRYMIFTAVVRVGIVTGSALVLEQIATNSGVDGEKSPEAGGSFNGWQPPPPVSAGSCDLPLPDGAKDIGDRPNTNDPSRTPIYRGVAQDHHAFSEALLGQAWPGDILGHTNAEWHNMIEDTSNSNLTSWTTNRDVAESFATKGGTTCGVVLESSIEENLDRLVESPDAYGESEVLIRGVVSDARVWSAGSA